jgi:hypothetical protein
VFISDGIWGRIWMAYSEGKVWAAAAAVIIPAAGQMKSESVATWIVALSGRMCQQNKE